MKTGIGAQMSNRGNLSSVVVKYIKEEILAGRYAEGNHILETEVAVKLGISRAPVREGIKELEKEGIVTVVPRRGTYVTEFNVEDIKEVFDIRLLLENDILKILIDGNKLRENDFIYLEELVEKMIKIAKSDMDYIDKSIAINLKDMKFHEYIWKKSESQRRVKILKDIFFQLRMAMLWDMDETGDLYVSATDHYEIIDNLKSKDFERCKKALKEHIISYKEGKF